MGGGSGRPEPALAQRGPGVVPVGGWFLLRNPSMLQIRERAALESFTGFFK